MLSRALRILFFLLIVRPVILVVIGLNVRHRSRLPAQGPAILVANHNSHLDTMVLMSLFPLSMLRLLRPVAAADYFLSTGLMAWFSTKIIGIIPIVRPTAEPGARAADPLAPVSRAIEEGSIVIFFPEGTRGEPEQIAKFRSGIARLAERHPEVPVVPIFLHGLGKILPKGEGILVPFFCDVFIGEAMKWGGSKDAFLAEVESRVLAMADSAPRPSWD